jgi:hypothetical protein
MDCMPKFYCVKIVTGTTETGEAATWIYDPENGARLVFPTLAAAEQHVEELPEMGADPQNIVVQEITRDD